MKNTIIDPAEMRKSIADLDRQIRVMKTYLGLVTEREDWHGVMDAAADLRELHAKRAVFVTLCGGRP